MPWLSRDSDIAIAYIEGIVVYSSAARDYIPAAVPSGAAQEARFPADTLGDSQEANEKKKLACKRES